MRFETFIAFRYLRGSRQNKMLSFITWLSVLGVMIGVMALIISLSIMNGFEKDLKAALMGANAHLTINSMRGHIDNQAADLNKIHQSLGQTAQAFPFTLNQALLMGGKSPQGSLIRGINPDLEMQSAEMLKRIVGRPDKSPSAILAELSAPNKIPGILVGKLLAQRLGLGVGDEVLLFTPQGRISPLGNLPRAKKFKLVGLYQSGLSGYDEVLAFINITEAQKIFRLENRITGIAVFLKDFEDAEDAKENLGNVFPFPFWISTWIEDNENLFAVMRLEKIGLFAILTLIILVAAFNITSSLVILTVEKRKDIAILKSMGAKDSIIRRIFIWQGSIIGTGGTIIGLVIGLLVCFVLKRYDIIPIPEGVYVNSHLPMHVVYWQPLLIAVVSFIICFLVTIYPAQQAAKNLPIEALRHD